MAFKDRMIQEAERAINQARIKREEMEGILEEIRADEEEARAYLQFLKSGKPTVASSNGRRKVTSEAEYMEAFQIIDSENDEWTHNELAEVLGINAGAASQAIRKYLDRGVLEVVHERGPGHESRTIRLTDETR